MAVLKINTRGTYDEGFAVLGGLYQQGRQLDWILEELCVLIFYRLNEESNSKTII